MTVHISAARKMLDTLMATPEGAQAFHACYTGLRDGRWSNEYMDSIGQHGVRGRSSWPPEQVAAFAYIHTMVSKGDIAMVPVSTDGEPHRDSAREANAAALSDLPHPFTASVDMAQNCADGDGHVTWSEPIEVTVATGVTEPLGDGISYPIPLHMMVPAGSATLEIGSSLPSRTWLHLREHGMVAHWPYGHNRFRLFIDLAWPERHFAFWDAMEKEVAAGRLF